MLFDVHTYQLNVLCGSKILSAFVMLFLIKQIFLGMKMMLRLLCTNNHSQRDHFACLLLIIGNVYRLVGTYLHIYYTYYSCFTLY